MPYMLLIEIALLVLMCTAIVYCHRLDRQLRILRSGRDHMLAAARDLGVSVQEARSALAAFEARARQSESKSPPILSPVPVSPPLSTPSYRADKVRSLHEPSSSKPSLRLRRRA